MAVQQITHKRITKYDTSNPNFKQTPKPEVEVNGNIQEDEDMYGEKKHSYYTISDEYWFYIILINPHGIIIHVIYIIL